MRPHLCHVFPTFGTGGPEVRTAQLINALGDAFRHTVVALNGDLAGRARVTQPDVAFLAGPPRRGRLQHPLDLARLLRGLAPDLVLTYGWGGTDGVLAARLSGIRRVIHAEDGFLPEEVHGQKLARLLARRVLLRAAARVVCPSHTLMQVARQQWRLAPRYLQYLPNGVDTQRFHPGSPDEIAAARHTLGLPTGDCVVGTVGWLRPEKNQGRLLRAFAQIAAGRPARLLIVGDGPLREGLVSEAQQAGLGDRVCFAGGVTDPVRYYHAMDLFALSSDTEQMPLVVLEAMSAGLPVLSTDVGDVRAMLGAGSDRYVVPLGKDDVYAATLAELLDDAAARRRLGEANRAKCLQEFSMEAMTQSYERLYRDVLNGG